MAQTVNQHLYLEAVRDHDLTISIGPAGTGKTYLAGGGGGAPAADLPGEQADARPAVEAGEKLGFLPGGLEAKGEPVPASSL